MSGMTPRRVLYVSGSGGANTLRYRVRMAEEALRSRGFATAGVHFTDPQLQQWADEADLVVLYRTPATRRVLRLIEHARETVGIPVTFDVDDLVFLPEHLRWIPFLDDLPARKRRLFEADVERRGNAVRFSDRASGTTAPVAADLARLTTSPVDVLPNGVSRVGQQLAARAVRRPPDGRIRIGYFSGSATHDDDWQVVEHAVVAAMTADPRVDLWLVGPLSTGPGLGSLADRVRVVKPVPWEQLPALLAEVDVNLAPLDVTPFTQGKSAIKWLEAALVGTPTLATGTQPFLEAIDDGRTGMIVPPGGDWTEPLAELLADAMLRQEIGEAARADALRSFGPEIQADRYRDFAEAALAGPRAEIDRDRLRAAVAEQGVPRGLGMDLEAYPFAPDLAGLSFDGPRGARALSLGRSSMRSVTRTTKRYARGALSKVRRR